MPVSSSIARRRTPATVLLMVLISALLLGQAFPALAQDAASSALPPPEPVSRAAAADASGLEVHLGLLGVIGPLEVPPTPAVGVTASDALMPNARDSLLDVGPVGDGPSLGEVNVLEINAQADIIDGVARSSAVVADVDLLQPALGEAHIITADVISAVSTTACTAQTAEEAAAGTALVGVTIAGQAIPVDVPINTTIEVPGIARVTLKEVVSDSDGIGWTVRGVHVRTLDPLTGLVDGEVIVSEAHSTVDCGFDEPQQPTTLKVVKSIVDGVVGADGLVPAERDSLVTYQIDVTNVTDSDCTLNRVLDSLPAPLTLSGTDAGLADIAATEHGANALRFDLTDVTLAAGETFTGLLTAAIPATIADGAYFNDAQAFGVCGTGRSGLAAGLLISDDEMDPCEAPTNLAVFNSTTRFAGSDRTDTALRVSGTISLNEADAVVIARSDKFPDALAASGLAAELCAPLLLNTPERLLNVNLDEIRRLDVNDVYLVGGEAALSDNVASALRAENLNVIRVSGATRYETARAIAYEIVRIGGPVARATFVRADIFPDAMSAANLATHARSPILLTDPDELTQVSADALPALLDGSADTIVYIGGGESAIDPAVEAELAQAYTTRRLSGLNRFETSVAFIQEAVRLGAIRDITWIASGTDFPDALTGSVGAFRQGAGLLLSSGENLDHSSSTRSYLQTYADAITTAVIVGGEAAMSSEVEQQILDAIRD